MSGKQNYEEVGTWQREKSQWWKNSRVPMRQNRRTDWHMNWGWHMDIHTEESDHAQILENGGMHDHTEGHGHHHPNSKAVSNRLARAIGHLEAVKRMVDREEDCAEILIQLAAVRSAINNAGKVILMDHLNHCIVEAVEDNDLDKIKEFGDAIQKFIK